MKIAISMRESAENQYGEVRDSIDQRLTRMIIGMKFIPVLVPNCSQIAEAFLREVSPNALLLSGGNNLVATGGDSPARDATEAALVDICIEKGLPVVGICRGMQFLIWKSGGTLKRSKGHAGTSHALSGCLDGVVTSHHDWVADEVPACFEILARAPDGTAEAIVDRPRKILGLMWHPERMDPPRSGDHYLLRKFLAGDDSWQLRGL